MLRISKLSDYGITAMTALPQAESLSAKELAGRTQLPEEALRKVLKMLVRAGLVESSRGSAGGYRLAKAAEDISMAEAIEAVDGPIALTECSIHDHRCAMEAGCGPRANWHLLNRALRLTLEQVSLADMAAPGSGRIAALARRVAPAQQPRSAQALFSQITVQHGERS